MTAVTTFFTQNYQELADIIVPNIQKYCDKHGYELFVNTIPDGNFHFIKTKDARKILEDYDLVWVVEGDILVTNHNFKVEDFIDNEHDLFLCRDINGANGGSLIIKNTGYSCALLDWINSDKNIGYGDEQNFFEQLDYQEEEESEILFLNHPSINSIPYQYYAPSYGYINWEQYEPRKEIPTHEMGNWEIGDFVCHLPGKTLQERIEIFNQIKEHIIL